METTAILFGSIGTLVETSELQRQAFNEAFEEANLDWVWERDDYKKMLEKSGGRQRIEDYAKSRGETVDATALHTRKTAIFDAAMVEDGLTLRPGVSEVIEAAKTSGTKLAFLTTTSRANVDAIFEAVGDQLSPEDFAFVGDASMVSSGKPSPDIYTAALNALGLEAASCVAIEDTGVSAQSPVAAGIDTVGFPGNYAVEADFDAAVRIRDTLEYKDLVGTG